MLEWQWENLLILATISTEEDERFRSGWRPDQDDGSALLELRTAHTLQEAVSGGNGRFGRPRHSAGEFCFWTDGLRKRTGRYEIRANSQDASEQCAMMRK